MPDRAEELRAALKQLHSQLQSVGTVDPEVRKLLQKADQEIHAVLAAPQGGSPPSKQAHAPIIDRLTEAAQHFEMSHPTVAGAVQRLIDALSQMGI